MTVKEAEQEIIEDFNQFDEWLDKYEYLIDLGKDLAPLDEKYKTDENLIKGCQSRVWVHSEVVNGKIVFTADSDAIITKGMISLLIKIYSGRTAKEITDSDFAFVDAIGLRENLSQTRSGGLSAMIAKIREIASSQE